MNDLGMTYYIAFIRMRNFGAENVNDFTEIL